MVCIRLCTFASRGCIVSRITGRVDILFNLAGWIRLDYSHMDPGMDR